MSSHFFDRVSRLALLGALLTLIACDRSPPQTSVGVEAKGANSVAAGRDVVIDKNTVINEYDVEKARKIEAGRFASTMHRECVQYVETVRGVQLQKEKRDRFDVQTPSILGRVYASVDTQRVLGEPIYKELNAQQAQLSVLRGKLITMRQQQSMSAAYAMMEQQGGRTKERLAGNPAPSADEFLATKDALLKGTEAHCRYLQTLM